jgi:hypothetical protein
MSQEASNEELAMESPDEEIHIEAEKASSGAKNQGVRYVLAISLALVIVAFLLVYMLRHG